jgi:hypothetical protein
VWMMLLFRTALYVIVIAQSLLLHSVVLYECNIPVSWMKDDVVHF